MELQRIPDWVIILRTTMYGLGLMGVIKLLGGVTTAL